MKRQPICFRAPGSTLVDGTEEFGLIHGGSIWVTDVTKAEYVCPTSGVLRDWFMRLTDGDYVQGAYTYTIVKNGVNTALQIVMTVPATTGSDYTHMVSVAAGDRLSVSCKSSGSPTWIEYPNRLSTLYFYPDNPYETVVWAMSSTWGSADTASWAAIDGEYYWYATNWGDTESIRQCIIPTAGVFKKLYINSDVAPGVGNSFTYHLRVNGVSTNITATLSGANTTASDTTNSARVVPGDLVNLLQDDPGGVYATVYQSISLVFVPDVYGEMIFMMCYPTFDGPLVLGATRYMKLSMPTTYSSYAYEYNYLLPGNSLLKKFYVAVSTAPGVGESIQCWICGLGLPGDGLAERLTNLYVNIAGASQTSGNDLEHIDYVVPAMTTNETEQWYCFKYTTSANASATKSFKYSVVLYNNNVNLLPKLNQLDGGRNVKTVNSKKSKHLR